MAEINNGGQAFPTEGASDSELYADPGMSLRDYFAATALTGLLAYPEAHLNGGTAPQAAATAYAPTLCSSNARCIHDPSATMVGPWKAKPIGGSSVIVAKASPYHSRTAIGYNESRATDRPVLVGGGLRRTINRSVYRGILPRLERTPALRSMGRDLVPRVSMRQRPAEVLRGFVLVDDSDHEPRDAAFRCHSFERGLAATNVLATAANLLPRVIFALPQRAAYRMQVS